VSATSAIARRTLKDSRVRTASFASLMLLIAYASTAGYQSAYPTPKDRIGFVHSFGANGMFRLFYGTPHDLLTVGGYSAWRVAGFCSLLAGAWGLITAVGALRGEEDAGRTELILAGTATRAHLLAGALLAVLLGAAVLWLALLLGLLAGDLPAGESAYMALATVSPALVFGAIGALVSQLASARRLALELSSALALALVLRALADTATGLGWLRWATPLGWTEQMRAFTGAQPLVLVLPLLAAAALLALTASIAASRDIGRGLLRTRDSHPPQLSLPSSPLALALREERGSLPVWVLGTGVYGAIIGVLSTAISSNDIPAALARQLKKIGAVSITTPTGAIGFYLLFFLLAVSLFACAQVSAARREEAERLETLLAQPFARGRWLFGRLALAAVGAAAIALAAGVMTWVGATVQGAGVSLARLLEAAVNCMPLALMFLGLGFLALALLPRAAGALSYGLVTIAFVWELFGSLLDAPHWIVSLTPFQHIGLVPAQAIRPGAAGVMLAIALGACALALILFQRRDLVGC
jgi:ABC-2 type transport system permease protein